MSDHFSVPTAQMDIMQRYPALFQLEPGAKRATLIGGCFACGEGWYPILDRLFADLEQIMLEDTLHGLKIIQVKEKFGGLRVYATDGNQRIYERINVAETEADATCESCGGSSPGVRDHGMWLGNICDACVRKRGDGR